MTEAHLHQLFNNRKLGNSFSTVDGNSIEVLKFGRLNKSSGPDFVEAMVRYDNVIWAGHIEFHLRSSDWQKHGHQKDPAYQNVIAHFVYEHDKEVFINNFKLPVVELKDQIKKVSALPKQVAKKSSHWVACAAQLHNLPHHIVDEQLFSSFANRSIRKIDQAIKLVKKYHGNHQKAFYHLLASALGGIHNKDSMTTLFERIEYETLQYLDWDQDKIGKYLRVLAGFESLNAKHDELQELHLIPISKVHWKTYGMRPPGQPFNRIKQLSIFLSRWPSVKFCADKASWQSFFQGFDKSIVNRIFINAVYPIIIARNWVNATAATSEFKKCLQQLDPENNTVIRKWSQLGVVAKNAYESQALIELKNEFCSEKKCLFCAIGKSVLSQ